jgi:hypothetical protein
MIKDVVEGKYLAARPSTSWGSVVLEWADDVYEVRKNVRWATEKAAAKYLNNLLKRDLSNAQANLKHFKEKVKEAQAEIDAIAAGHADSNSHWNSPGYQLQNAEHRVVNLKKLIDSIKKYRKKIDEGTYKVVEENVGDFQVRFRNGREVRISEKGSAQASCVMCGVYLNKIPFANLRIEKGRICPICLQALHQKTKHLIDKMDPEHVKAIKRSRFVREL